MIEHPLQRLFGRISLPRHNYARYLLGTVAVVNLLGCSPSWEIKNHCISKRFANVHAITFKTSELYLNPTDPRFTEHHALRKFGITGHATFGHALSQQAKLAPFDIDVIITGRLVIESPGIAQRFVGMHNKIHSYELKILGENYLIAGSSLTSDVLNLVSKDHCRPPLSDGEDP
ncbi:hypothetical protein [Microbulbifer magnicolonia]|uniref:hypothetical protein n=1 Tax=Microbulbifer magnicolonia TaxID=3109744 RepID=UPI002B417B2D|nr:hypothetical protein [Microbulbifer sp. GG15]